MRVMYPRLIFHPALWALNLLLWAVCAIWIALAPRISLSAEGWPPLMALLGVCTLATLYIRREMRGQPARLETLRRPLALAAGTLFMLTAFLAIRLLNHLSMSLSMPMADDVLAHYDSLIGANWYGYATWLGRHPAVLPIVRFPYSTTTTCAYLVFLALALSGRLERAVEFGSLLFLAALFTVSVAAFFPAEAAMVHHMDPVLRVMFHGDAGVYHLEALRALRSSEPIRLTILSLPGLATFPSFHTIAGLLVVYACRDGWRTLALATVWTGLMLLATPVYGGHYFIDILAGGIVAALLLAANAAWRPFASPRASSPDAVLQDARQSA